SPGDLDAHVAAPRRDDPASRAPREPTSGAEPAERWRRSETSPAGAPRRSGRSGDFGSQAMHARDDEPRPAFAALDRGAHEPEAKPDAAGVSMSIARGSAETEGPASEHGAPAWSARRRVDDESPPVLAAPTADRDRESAARLVPSLTDAPPGRSGRERGAE